VRSTRSTRVPALLGAAALLTASLAGCAAIPGFGGCDPVYQPGEASDLVTADGSFPTPLVSKTPEVSLIEAGDGALVRAGDQVDYTFARFLGKDGQDLSGETAAGRIAAGVDDDAVSEALVCAHVGDRIALTSTIAQAYGEGSGGSLSDDDTIVVIIDIEAAFLGKADGINQLPQDGMPTVATEVDGTPGITVPAEAPPAASRSSVIKGGDGATVKDDSTAVVHYSFWTWPAAEGDEPALVESSWTEHTAQNLQLAQVPSDLRDAISGQKVGSQVLLVLAPGEGSFPADAAPPAGADATYIFVIDLLGIQE